ncbi:zinc-ribbon domain-containing protein [bacterium]|nr:zinc-ribbon domain-containing protein [bacterium]
MDHQRVFYIFFGAWVVLGAASYLFFTRYRNAAVKTAVWPFYLAGIGLVFLAFIFLQGVRGTMLYIAAAATGVIMCLNYAFNGFCERCGAMVPKRSAVCPKCGEKRK